MRDPGSGRSWPILLPTGGPVERPRIRATPKEVSHLLGPPTAGSTERPHCRASVDAAYCGCMGGTRMNSGETCLSRRQLVLAMAAAGGSLLAGCGPLPFHPPPPTPVKVYRLGWLHGGIPAANILQLDTFRQALGELGYLEGQNLVIEYRWGDGSDAPLVEAAAELVRLPVDLLVVPSTPVARIARAATTTVPIVVAGGDPVVFGLAVSHARPGGNVTGVTGGGSQIPGKRLQLLKEAVPSISRVAIFWDVVSSSPFDADSWERDAQAVGVDFYPLLLHGPEDLEPAFEAAAREGADALLIGPNPLAAANRARIAQLAARLRWPAIYYQRLFVSQGGLMSYEGSLAETWRRAAFYVDKILKGANPAELPIEQPMRFDFTLNLATAEALGLSLPESTRLQVTEVIR
jgi:putative tryptophan/tyrosine transport system substrate-binding protein